MDLLDQNKLGMSCQLVRSLSMWNLIHPSYPHRQLDLGLVPLCVRH